MRTTRKAATNSTYPKGGVSCFADSFVVAESSVLRMKFSGKYPRLRQYPNRTRNASPLHFECGYLFIKENGTIELLNAQNSGRVEALLGTVEKGERGMFSLSLESKFFGNDERMIKSTRKLSFTINELNYEMYMSTSSVAKLQFHLKASLKKSE